MKLRIGDLAFVAAMLDGLNTPEADKLTQRNVTRKRKNFAARSVATEYTIDVKNPADRAGALELLYYLESCPAAWADGQDKTEVSAVRRTVRVWRKALGLKYGETTPVPESANA